MTADVEDCVTGSLRCLEAEYRSAVSKQGFDGTLERRVPEPDLQVFCIRDGQFAVELECRPEADPSGSLHGRIVEGFRRLSSEQAVGSQTVLLQSLVQMPS